MDYEKKYKESLERAKELYDFYKDNPRQAQKFVDIFPELEESKDEKIKKALYKMAKVPRKEIYEAEGITKEQALAWLKKQGNLMSALQEANKRIGELVEENYNLREQKPAWSEVDGEILKSIILSFELRCTTGDNDLFEAQIEWLKSLKDRVQPQPKQEWSEEDNETLDRIISNYQYFCNKLSLKDELTEVEKEVINKVDKEDIDWLKDLKDRVQPQPKQEWSGGDEAHLHSLITHLEQWIERHPNTTGADIQGENVTWLKSLKLKLKD